jgi:hypothetical protein
MNIFKQLAEGMINTEVTYTVEKEGCSVELYGTIVIKKNGIERTNRYWARTSEVRGNIIEIDEWDGDWEDTTFNGLKIDSYDAFKKGFEDHGMKSIAESLDITYEEQRKVIYQAVANHKMFKKVYGGKARLFESMNDEEQKQFYYESLMIGKFVPTQKRVDYGWNVDGKDLSIEEIIKLENI